MKPKSLVEQLLSEARQSIPNGTKVRFYARDLADSMLSRPLGDIYLKNGDQLQKVTPEQAAEVMRVYSSQFDDPISVPTIKLYDADGRKIGYVSYNGRTWLGDPDGDQIELQQLGRKTCKQRDVEGWKN